MRTEEGVRTEEEARTEGIRTEEREDRGGS